MNYRRLGRSGLMVGEMALGTMNLGRASGDEEAARIIRRAIDAGINLLDCADVYADGNSETVLGRTLKADGTRKQVLVTSKVYLPSGPGPNDRGNSRHHILESCAASLKRLQTDYIDIYFLHRTDWNVPQEETLAALDHLVRQGWVRYVACSTHPPWRTVEAMHIADRLGYPRFVCEEPPYNLLDRRIETELVPMCAAYDLGILAWSPLAQGMLAAKLSDPDNLPPGSRGTTQQIYRERITRAGIAVANKVAARAAEKGCTPACLAVAWVLNQPGITATIVGPRTLTHLEDLLPAAEIRLDDADRAFFDDLVPPGAHVSDHFNTAGWRAP